MLTTRALPVTSAHFRPLETLSPQATNLQNTTTHLQLEHYQNVLI